jgi:undecaprenyl-diphosphatase
LSEVAAAQTQYVRLALDPSYDHVPHPAKVLNFQMFDLDNTWTQGLNALAGKSAALDVAVIWLSDIGVPLMVFAVAIQWWRGPDRALRRHDLVSAGLAFLLGLAVNQMILLFVHRLRPYDAGLTHLLIAPATDPSFPSDHATAAFSIAASFLLASRRAQGFAFAIAALMVMLSRVYIGTHYVSDVVGGATIGFCAAAVIRALYRRDTALDRMVTGLL